MAKQRHRSDAAPVSSVSIEVPLSPGRRDADTVEAIRRNLQALEQRAIDAIFNGTEWLTAEQIGHHRNPDAVNPHAVANRWASEGKVFGLSKGGTMHYPRYAFDEAFDPLPVIRRILTTLTDFSPWRIASWLESTNTHLGGARPRDRLAQDPEGVVRAAQAHALGPVHG